MTTARPRIRRLGAALVVGALAVVALAACGDDDDTSATTTAAPATSTTTATTATTFSGAYADYCEAATALQATRRDTDTLLGNNPEAADPGAVQAVVTAQYDATRRAAAVAPEELAADYATVADNFSQLVDALEAADWDYGAAVADPAFRSLLVAGDTPNALNRITTFDIAECGLIP
ncbi:MAG: hypothetical protein IPM45_00655 [Acidimicrobiales bacterium]|nr:hypothetical protein [Acidimicrobiales bacterium]